MSINELPNYWMPDPETAPTDTKRFEDTFSHQGIIDHTKSWILQTVIDGDETDENNHLRADQIILNQWDLLYDMDDSEEDESIYEVDEDTEVEQTEGDRIMEITRDIAGR